MNSELDKLLKARSQPAGRDGGTTASDAERSKSDDVDGEEDGTNTTRRPSHRRRPCDATVLPGPLASVDRRFAALRNARTYGIDFAPRDEMGAMGGGPFHGVPAGSAAASSRGWSLARPKFRWTAALKAHGGDRARGGVLHANPASSTASASPAAGARLLPAPTTNGSSSPRTNGAHCRGRTTQRCGHPP